MPRSPTGQKLLAELGGKKRGAIERSRENLASEDIVELICKETAQFDRETHTLAQLPPLVGPR